MELDFGIHAVDISIETIEYNANNNTSYIVQSKVITFIFICFSNRSFFYQSRSLVAHPKQRCTRIDRLVLVRQVLILQHRKSLQYHLKLV